MIPYKMLLERAEDSPDKTVFISTATGELTFAQLADRTCRLAKGLKESGLGKGDVVGALLPNCMETVELFIAAGAFHMPLICATPLAFCLVAFRLSMPAKPLVALWLGAAIGGAWLVIFYWRYVLPNHIKSRVWRRVGLPTNSSV